MSETIFIVCYVLLIVSWIWFFNRNHKVCKFRQQIIQEDYNRAIESIERGDFSDLEFRNYHKLPSYDKMLFSLKPLKHKYWL